MNKNRPFVAVLLASLLCASGVRAEPDDSIPFASALAEANVTLSSLASGQTESVMLGNGDLYGIVWEKDGGLYMRVTKNDIWDARVDTSADPPLPKVDVRNNRVTGPTGAPPSYAKPYPQPRCAAALRFGAGGRAAAGARWTCIRPAPSHGFALANDGSTAVMYVAGAAGVSTGYRAALDGEREFSALNLKMAGTPNALYYVDVYDREGRNVFASGWTRSPATAKPIVLPFEPAAVGRVDLFAQTTDGRRAENSIHSIHLIGDGGTTPVRLPPSSRVRAVLDLRRAVATLHPDEPAPTRIRILADRNVVLIHTPGPVAIEPIAAAHLPDAETGQTDGAAWLHMKMPGDVDYSGMEYALAVVGREDLKAVALVTSFDGPTGDVRTAAVALARRTLDEDPAALVAEHERQWQRFWSRSGIELADKEMQRWWYRMIYFARTISRPGASPPGLMPPLATDATPWHADFHFNYNSWQAFWPVVSANHPAQAESWIAYVDGMLPRAKWLAKQTYDCDGAFYSISQFLHEPDPAVCKSKNGRQLSMNPWGLTIGMAGMTAQSLWHKHLCQPDREYLEAKIYPSLREVARFYVSYMQQCGRGEDGKITLAPAYSPEHGPMGVANCPFDIAYIHYTFDAFRRAAGELDRDAELAAECLAMKRLLPDYPVALDGDGEPVVVDWQGCKYRQVPVHNVTVPASPVFPAEQVTWFSPEPVKALFRRTIKDTRFNGNNSHVMFNIAKARLSMPEAVTDSRAWFASRELPNGLFIWQGHAHGTFMAESIGIAGLVTEFLMQSVDDTVRVFPCWPKDSDARFRRLRAQGGLLVSARQTGGRVQEVTIESTVDGRLRLLSPWETVNLNGGKIEPNEAGILELPAKAGDVFRFGPGEP